MAAAFLQFNNSQKPVNDPHKCHAGIKKIYFPVFPVLQSSTLLNSWIMFNIQFAGISLGGKSYTAALKFRLCLDIRSCSAFQKLFQSECHDHKSPNI